MESASRLDTTRWWFLVPCVWVLELLVTKQADEDVYTGLTLGEAAFWHVDAAIRSASIWCYPQIGNKQWVWTWYPLSGSFLIGHCKVQWKQRDAAGLVVFVTTVTTTVNISSEFEKRNRKQHAQPTLWCMSASILLTWCMHYVKIPAWTFKPLPPIEASVS